jgi:hypothetical protein
MRDNQLQQCRVRYAALAQGKDRNGPKVNCQVHCDVVKSWADSCIVTIRRQRETEEDVPR